MGSGLSEVGAPWAAHHHPCGHHGATGTLLCWGRHSRGHFVTSLALMSSLLARDRWRSCSRLVMLVALPSAPLPVGQTSEDGVAVVLGAVFSAAPRWGWMHRPRGVSACWEPPVLPALSQTFLEPAEEGLSITSSLSGLSVLPSPPGQCGLVGRLGSGLHPQGRQTLQSPSPEVLTPAQPGASQRGRCGVLESTSAAAPRPPHPTPVLCTQEGLQGTRTVES